MTAAHQFIQFLGRHPRFLLFGLMLAAMSSFGQTFFISLFSGEIRDDFGISHAEFGLLYSSMTIVSGLSMLCFGRLVDQVPLRSYVVVVLLGMAAGAMCMAAAPNLLLIGLAIYLLRFCGQGLLSHGAVTSMARYFDRERGRAVAVASLGFPAGESVLPILGVVMIGSIGFRASWWVIAIFLLLCAPVVAGVLLKGHAERHRAWLDRSSTGDEATGESAPHRSRRVSQVLRDPGFYLLLPAALAAPFLLTGIFFHQVHLVDVRGWSLALFAGCFAFFAFAQLPASLGAGMLVDRLTARSVAPFAVLPMAAGFALLSFTAAPWSVPVFMVMAGMTAGSIGPTYAALWAERYGTRHLGAIRGMVAGCMVLSTGAAPGLMGLLIERDISLDRMFFIGSVGAVLAAATAFVVLTRR